MKICMTLYQRKNGYFYIRFYRGKEQSLLTQDKIKAKELFRRMEEDYLHGKLLHLSNYKAVTLGEFRKNYVEMYRSGLKIKTTNQDKLSLKLLAEVIGDNTHLSIIAAKARYPHKPKIEEFKSALLVRNVKPVSINSYMRHIKIAFNIAQEHDLIEKKPAIKMVPVGKRLPKILYPEQIEKVLAKAKEDDPIEWLYYMLLLWTGARREEAARADWSRISLVHDHIKYVGKADRERMVTLLPPIKEALLPFKKDLGPVFPHQHLDTYTHHFKKLVRDCGITDIHLHNLRHTAATYMLKSGIDIKVVQKILGHASVTTTEIYADVLDEMIKQQMTKFQFK